MQSSARRLRPRGGQQPAGIFSSCSDRFDAVRSGRDGHSSRQRGRPAGARADGRLLLRLGLVSFSVQRQMVGAAEGAVARLADERLGAGVLANVSGQLVRAGEAPVAALPGAEVRLLA